VRILVSVIVLATLLIATSTASFAQKRIALIVGNGSYGSVVPLDNPVNDAGLIART